MKIHRSNCPNVLPRPSLQVSLDGVSEAKSNTVSLDVYSFRTDECLIVYPVLLVRPIARYRGIDNQQQLHYFVEDVSTVGNISKFIGDNPKRAIARQSLSHSSTYPCEYCFGQGTRHSNTTELSEKKMSYSYREISLLKN